MDEGLKWLLQNGDHIGSFTILLAFLLSFYRGWIVLGSTHQDCLKDRDEFRAEVKAIAKGNEDKIARLEAEIEAMRDHRGTKAR